MLESLSSLAGREKVEIDAPMKFTSAEIAGVFVIDIEPIADDRGFFARAWCREEFRRQGLVENLAQSSIAWSPRRATLRGLHYLAAPHQEAKLVRATRGAAFVVVADIRRDSPSHGRWMGIELTADNRRSLYVPPGCAQGYQTLADETEMLYQMSTPYVSAASRGIRFDDPYFQIHWPLEIGSISQIDRNWPDYEPQSAPAAAGMATTI
jgi:dTDP-4-dehydrorhamnose 3,5-epimerase